MSATVSVTPRAAICCSKARPHWQAQLEAVAIRRAAPAMVADGGGPLGGLVGNALGHCLEAVRPALDEVMVVQVFGDDDVQQRHGQDGVGAGTDGQPVVGAGAPPGETRVDGDDAGTHLHALDQPVAHETVGVGLDGLATPDQEHARHGPILVGVTVGMELRRVGDEHVAELGGRADHARQVAGEAREAERGHVGRLHAGGGEVRDLPADVAAGAVDDDDGLGAILGLRLECLLGDLVVSLIPGDALPLVLATLAGATQRVLQAVGMVDGVGHGQAAHAQLAVGNRIQRVALNLHQSVVLGVEQHATAFVATRRRPVGGTRHGELALLPLPLTIMVSFAVELLEPLFVVSHVSPLFSLSCTNTFGY